MDQTPPNKGTKTQEEGDGPRIQRLAVRPNAGAGVRTPLQVHQGTDCTPREVDIRWVTTADSLMEVCEPYIEEIRLAFLELLAERERKRQDEESKALTPSILAEMKRQMGPEH